MTNAIGVFFRTLLAHTFEQPSSTSARLYSERELRDAVAAAIEAERARREPYPRDEA
jgi:hypothetical protein